MPLAISPSEDKLPDRKIVRGENPDRAKLASKHKGDCRCSDCVPIIQRRKAAGNLKPMRFVSLHHHSTFSYKDGYQLPKAHVRRATELNMTALAMTEHGNTDSHVKFEAAAEKAGVKPIFGCEIYMPAGDDPFGDTPSQRKHHLTVLAKNAVGYRNLLDLVSTSWAEGFYYDPTVTWDMLCARKEGLVILSGCQGSLLFCSTVGGKGIEPEDASYGRGLKVAQKYADEFGENYFIECQAFPELDLTNRFNPLAARIARAVRRKLVGTMDCHYTELEEAEVQLILHNIRGGNKQTVEEQAREWGYDVPLCPPPNDRSIWRRLQQTGLSKEEAGQAIVSTEEIAAECNVTLPKLPMIRFPVPKGYVDSQAYFEHCLREGWKYRGFDKLSVEERRRAKTQVRREKGLIELKGYVDYFLLVRMGVVFCKDAGVAVGPGRGSAAASLVAYLLRITEINPLKYPLLVFERFIDETREDLPDIDLDFPSEARPALRDFYSGVFGEGCVNNIGTFTVFKNKLALDDVARVFRIPQYEIETVKDFLIERSSGDLRASSTIEDTAEQFPQAREIFDKYPDLRKSQLLEGNVKGFGVHAAGLVLSNEPIRSICAVYEREVPKGSGNVAQVVSLDKYDAERQGLVKMDFLGLSTMSMIQDATNFLGISIEDLYTLPLDDPKVLDGFRANDVVGVFQFDGKAMRSVCGTLKPDSFSEVCDVVALARPGPLHNGAASAYAEIKHGTRTAERLHPSFDAITGPTQYQIVYQEQILRIVREVGNFPWTHAALIRQIIARKEGEAAFNSHWERFREGAQTVHERMPEVTVWDAATGKFETIPNEPMSVAVAKQGWGSMITSGSYAFNAAHTYSYGLLSYWTMWLKVYHPDVFFACSLAQVSGGGEKPKARRRSLLRDGIKHGIRVLPPSYRRSGAVWRPSRRPGCATIGGVRVNSKPAQVPSMRMGFEQIEGIAEKGAKAILDYRDEHGLKSWDELINIPGIGTKTIEKIQAFVSNEDPFGAFALDRHVLSVKDDILAGRLGKVPHPTHTAVDIPYDKGTEFECVWLGTILSRNIRDIFEMNRAKTGEELDVSKVRDPHLNEWAQLVAEDETDQLLIKIDRKRYPMFKHALFDFRLGQDLLLVEGIRSRYTSARQINVKKMWVIDPR